jgi:hypothetical protein
MLWITIFQVLIQLAVAEKKTGSAITPATAKLKDKEHLKPEKDFHAPKTSKSSPGDLVGELATRVRGTNESSPS